MICKVGECGRIIDSHGAKGMCHRCYERNRRKSNKLQVKINREKWLNGLTLKQKERMKKMGKSTRAKRRQEYKAAVISYYSAGTNACTCINCNESNIEFMCIDHIKGGGTKIRKTKGGNGGGVNFYRTLMLQNFPKGYRVLCHNCNSSIGFFGYCPHDKK